MKRIIFDLIFVIFYGVFFVYFSYKKEINNEILFGFLWLWWILRLEKNLGKEDKTDKEEL